jgi:hypothetical protein
MASLDTIRQVFEIGVTAVDQNALAQRIAHNLQAHNLQTPDTWPAFVLTAVQPPENAPFTPELYAALAQANQHYDKIWVEMSLAKTRFPLLKRLKRSAHQLVLFYVNQLGQRQIAFNDRILRVVNRIVSTQAERDADMEALKQQIAALQARIEELEQKQS